MLSKKIIFLFFIVLSSHSFSQKVNEQKVVLYYGEGKKELKKNQKTILDSILGVKDIIEKIQRIKITGYCDFKGSKGSNLSLSIDRAQIVKSYLVKNGVPQRKFSWCEGRGEENSNDNIHIKSGVPNQRRVELVYYLDKEELILDAISLSPDIPEIVIDAIVEVKIDTLIKTPDSIEVTLSEPVIKTSTVIHIKEVIKTDTINIVDSIPEIMDDTEKLKTIIDMEIGEKLVVPNLNFLPGRHFLKETS
ncbi:MAG: OmpA family protein, partial [Flavobacteriales bacterium]|nr:OmpA family protein [Flavobacteriales bacterium]